MDHEAIVNSQTIFKRSTIEWSTTRLSPWQTRLVFIAFVRSRRGNVSIVCFSHGRTVPIKQRRRLIGQFYTHDFAARVHRIVQVSRYRGGTGVILPEVGCRVKLFSSSECGCGGVGRRS
jgi:hypothetical protein